MRRSTLAFILTLALVVFGADASRADNFYQDKRITIVVGYSPGGGIDTAGRLMAKHLGRFIPGNPSIIVQNMEGGGGVIAANYIARAKPDGLTLAVPGRSWFIVGVVKNPAAKFEPAALDYLIDKHYRSVNRPFRCCQPRDLLLQIVNYCRYMGQTPDMSSEHFDFAVENYFAIM